MEDRKALLREKAANLPLRPGVYLMRDRTGKIIYVGKSKVLKNRVSQYFHESGNMSVKTARMVSHVYDFETILTDSEMEALTLENSLIKLHAPKYNIKLKDDKNYPYIRITVHDDYPKIMMVRRRAADSAKYFGPYSSAKAVYSILMTIRKTFKIAACKKEFPRDIGKGRPCIYSQIGQCCAPCSGKVTPEEYQEIFKHIVELLRGDFGHVKKSMEEKMFAASEEMRFEAAAQWRDRISHLDALWQKQKVVSSPDTEQDVFALYQDDTCACLSVFYIRGGCLIDCEPILFGADQIVESDAIDTFLFEFYQKRQYVPKEILLGFSLDGPEREALVLLLGELAGRRVKIREPERGPSRSLCEMARENAEQNAKQYRQEMERDNRTLVKLASLLRLETVPERIEAYDISNIGSEHITAGMIVVEQGKFKKKDYRTFTIRETEGQDDYASMRETLRRRLERLTKEDARFGAEAPDLILLDGGKGHVSVIRALLSELKMDIPVFGMVKDEYHKTRALTDGENEINIAREQPVFVFVYKIQEEVHRYTVARMSGAKSKTLKTSVLEKIDGVGKTRARDLLAHFKTIAAVRGAGVNELAEVKGISRQTANNIYAYFHNES